MGSPDAELSIQVVNDIKMAEYQKTFLDREGPTNVLAFPMSEGPFAEISPDLLGDVVISAETTLEEAKNSQISFETRFFELMIHGILHLFGFDHATEEESAIMYAKAEKLMQIVGNA